MARCRRRLLGLIPGVFCYAATEQVELETAGQIFFYLRLQLRLAERCHNNNMNLYHPVVVTQALPTTLAGKRSFPQLE